MFELMARLLLNKQIKLEEGRMEVLGIRDSFTPLDTYIQIQKEIINLKGEDFIYQSAKKAGFNWFQKMAKNFSGLTQEKASNWGVDLIALSGWGIAKAEKLDFKNNTGKYILENSIIARNYGVANKPVDHLFRGLLAGGMSFATKVDIDCIELTCVALGDSRCEFFVGPKDMVEKYSLKKLKF